MTEFTNFLWKKYSSNWNPSLHLTKFTENNNSLKFTKLHKLDCTKRIRWKFKRRMTRLLNDVKRSAENLLSWKYRHQELKADDIDVDEKETYALTHLYPSKLVQRFSPCCSVSLMRVHNRDVDIRAHVLCTMKWVNISSTYFGAESLFKCCVRQPSSIIESMPRAEELK